MSDPYQNVIDQMIGAGLNGLTPSDLIVDGKLKRFKPDGEKKKRGWYVLFEFRTDRGETLISGAFGWFKGADVFSFDVSVGGATFSDEDHKRYAELQRERARLAAKERATRARDAAKRAQLIWDKLPDSGSSPYLDRKKVRAFGLRFSRGSIVVPLRNHKGMLCGLQFIDPDGNKKFLTGTAKKGAHHLIPGANKLAVVEGYATGATIYEAMGWTVAVAFDAGNLLPVVEALLADPTINALTPVIICGDDDRDNPLNPGRTKAVEVTRRNIFAECRARFPDFTGISACP